MYLLILCIGTMADVQAKGFSILAVNSKVLISKLSSQKF